MKSSRPDQTCLTTYSSLQTDHIITLRSSPCKSLSTKSWRQCDNTVVVYWLIDWVLVSNYCFLLPCLYPPSCLLKSIFACLISQSSSMHRICIHLPLYLQNIWTLHGAWLYEWLAFALCRSWVNRDEDDLVPGAISISLSVNMSFTGFTHGQW